MEIKHFVVISVLMFFLFFVPFAYAQLLSENDAGFNGETRGSNYDTLLSALSGNNNVVTSINNQFLWVPWYKTSSSCLQSDLQSGNNCNSGQTIDSTHNCMVTDEFSQVGILLSMSKDQQKMTQFYNTVKSINSTFGALPAWRVYDNGGTIEACKPGIDGNCDTASDGTARIIIALFTASKNPYLTDAAAKANYASLAKQMSDDFLKYEVDQTCRPSSLGNLGAGANQICYWMAGGSQVKKGGIASSDYAYTGYFADGTIAMLAAYSATGNTTYLDAAKNIELNYLQAANFDGNTFSAPPGKSFKWAVDASGVPRAQCTNTCSPVIWDMMDASRAAGMCQANYYAHSMGVTLPGLDQYCNLWGSKYMNDPNSAPIQFTPSGSAGTSQSGFFAQGLEALFQSGGPNPLLFQPTLDSALKHYNPTLKTFDNTACFGVYTQAFAVRALGMGIGRDALAFTKPAGITIIPTPNNTPTSGTPANTTTSNSGANTTLTTTTVITTGIASLSQSCTANDVACVERSDVTSGVCRRIVYGTTSGDIKLLACVKTGNYVEIYKQSAPSGINYKACLANGCVSNANGFARFIPVMSTPITNPVPQPAPEPTPTPVTPSAPEPTPTPITPPADTIVPSPVPAVPSSGVMSISMTVKPSGTLISDTADGSTCRILKYDTPNGEVDSKICDKGTNQYNSHTYEMYQLTQSNGAQICFANTCVGVTTGFATFSN